MGSRLTAAYVGCMAARVDGSTARTLLLALDAVPAGITDIGPYSRDAWPCPRGSGRGRFKKLE